jgi:hypothetical protein
MNYDNEKFGGGPSLSKSPPTFDGLSHGDSLRVVILQRRDCTNRHGNI